MAEGSAYLSEERKKKMGLGESNGGSNFPQQNSFSAKLTSCVHSFPPILHIVLNPIALLSSLHLPFMLLLPLLELLLLAPQAYAGNGNSSILPLAHVGFFTAMFPTIPVPISLFVPDLIATQRQEAFLMSLADARASTEILPGTELKYLLQPVPPSGAVTATGMPST